MHRFICLIACFAFLAGCSEASDRQSVQYDIRYVADEVPWLEVTVTISSDGSGYTAVTIPAREQHQPLEGDSWIQGVEVLSDYTSIGYRGGRYFDLEYAPDQNAVLRYRIYGVSREEEIGFGHGGPSRIVTRNFVHLSYDRALIAPSWSGLEIRLDDKINVAINWIDLPDGWTVADSFSRGRTRQRFQTTARIFRGSRAIAGELQTTTRNVRGSRIQVAMVGDWNFSLREFANAVETYADAHREFWGDDRNDGYLATLVGAEVLKDGENSRNSLGNASENGFVIYASPTIRLNSLRGLISHEYLHRWIANAFGQPESPYQASRWFTEGFTQFYAAYIPFRAGILTDKSYFNWSLSPVFQQFSSEHSNATQEEMVENWGVDPSYVGVPYWRGQLLAANWHTTLAKQTNGETHLHDLLFAFRDAQQSLVRSGEPREWNSEDVIRLLEAEGFDLAREHYQNFVVEGQRIPEDFHSFGPCYSTYWSLDGEEVDTSNGPPSNESDLTLEYVHRDELPPAQRAACLAWLDLD